MLRHFGFIQNYYKAGVLIKGKGKGKVHPRTGPEGPKGTKGIVVLFL
jgi:hypothetical protein